MERKQKKIMDGQMDKVSFRADFQISENRNGEKEDMLNKNNHETL